MKNFRPGFLKRGYPLGNLTKTVNLTRDNISIDPTGYGVVKLVGVPPVTTLAATSAGTGPYTITVTSVAHGLTTGDVINVFGAAGWTTSANADKDNASVTVLTDDTFTYEVLTDPGASGTVHYKLAPEMRTFTLIDGRVNGTILVIYLSNDASAELKNSTNVNLSSDWAPLALYDNIQLMWQDTAWFEVDRTMPASDVDVFVYNPTAGQMLVYDGTDSRFENVSITGDIGITGAGVASISAGVIEDADVSATAAIDQTKLAALTANQAVATDASGFLVASSATDAELGYLSGVTSAIQTQIDDKIGTALTDSYILVGDATNLATGVAMSGDATISNTGAVTIASEAVTVDKLAPTVMKEVTGTISQAEILALETTPVQAIAAAGSGVVIIVDEVQVFHDYDTAAYTAGGDLTLRYASGTSIESFLGSVVTDTADGQFLSVPTIYDVGTTATLTGFAIITEDNLNVEWYNTGAAFADGDSNNVLKYRIRYHEVNLLV